VPAPGIAECNCLPSCTLHSGAGDLLAVTTAFHLAEHSLADGRTAVLFFTVRGPMIASKSLPETAKLGSDQGTQQDVKWMKAPDRAQPG